jgi:nitrile hydratase subunit beta
MRWPSDMGGMTQFGPVKHEKNEPLFHEPWERRVLGLALAMGATGSWTIDQNRHAREVLPDAKYWSASYYEIWLEGLTRILREHGLVTAKDLAAQRVVDPPKPVTRVLRAEDVATVLAKGSPYERPARKPAAFAVGDQVKTLLIDAEGHCRLPRYAQQKCGEILRVHGCHVFPDTSAARQGENPQWLYSVKFAAQDLWGRPSHDHVFLDLWEPYLEQI